MAPELPELDAETIEVARQAGRSRLRPGAAQQRQFEDLDGVLERAARADPARAMAVTSSVVERFIRTPSVVSRRSALETRNRRG